MKLQISFGMTDLDKALTIAAQVAEYADILEISTLLLYQHGVHAIEQFTKQFANKVIVADAKIVDHGTNAADLFGQTDCDWITIMAGTSKQVIHAATTTAHKLGKKVIFDLLDADSLGQAALDAKQRGADALLFHEPYDEEESLLFLEKWDMVQGNTDLPIFVSANITRENIDQVIAVKPYGIIIGKSITEAKDPAAEAQFFQAVCKQ